MSRLAATLLCACAVLTGGCADNQETLIVLFAPLWEDDGSCMVNTSTEDSLLFGLLDVSFGTPYLMPAVLLNNSGKQPINDNNTGVISNEIQLVDAQVSIDSPQAGDMLDGVDDSLLEFTAALSTNSIKPAEEVGVLVEVLPSATVKELAPLVEGLGANARLTVRANVVFNATRSNNDVGNIGRIKARDFSFPIQLCSGCLLYCGGCEGGNGCPVQSSSFSGGVCGNAQDLAVWPSECEGPSN